MAAAAFCFENIFEKKGLRRKRGGGSSTGDFSILFLIMLPQAILSWLTALLHRIFAALSEPYVCNTYKYLYSRLTA